MYHVGQLIHPLAAVVGVHVNVLCAKVPPLKNGSRILDNREEEREGEIEKERGEIDRERGEIEIERGEIKGLNRYT